MLHPVLNSGSARVMAQTVRELQRGLAAMAADPVTHPYRTQSAGLSGYAIAVQRWLEAVTDAFEQQERAVALERKAALRASAIYVPNWLEEVA